MSYKVFETVERYSKMDNGRWHLDSADEHGVIPKEWVKNNVEASDWFRRLGGYERTERKNTVAGYVPVKQISISPDGLQKRVFIWKYVEENTISPDKCYGAMESNRESRVMERE